MRAVIQRVSRAEVRVDGGVVASIDRGLVVLVGVATGDGEPDAIALGEKVAALRIFADADGKMNQSVGDVGGGVIVVSQFTLLADLRRGRRPSFTGAADSGLANRLIDAVVECLATAGTAVQTGRFGEHMDVDLVNDGPVTIILDVGDGVIG